VKSVLLFPRILPLSLFRVEPLSRALEGRVLYAAINSFSFPFRGLPRDPPSLESCCLFPLFSFQNLDAFSPSRILPLAEGTLEKGPFPLLLLIRLFIIPLVSSSPRPHRIFPRWSRQRKGNLFSIEGSFRFPFLPRWGRLPFSRSPARGFGAGAAFFVTNFFFLLFFRFFPLLRLSGPPLSLWWRLLPGKDGRGRPFSSVLCLSYLSSTHSERREIPSRSSPLFPSVGFLPKSSLCVQ